MAGVRVPIDDFERGRLPQVCVLTGEQGADVRWNLTGESRSGAQILLLFFGIVPYVLVRAVTRKTTVGSVWVSEAGQSALRARRRRTDRRRLVAGLIGVVLAAFGAAGWRLVPLGASFLVVVLGLVVTVGALVVRIEPIGVEVEGNGRWVRLDGVAAGAAAAYQDALVG